jgi:D-alanyl-D-alanine carboxypeptidase
MPSEIPAQKVQLSTIATWTENTGNIQATFDFQNDDSFQKYLGTSATLIDPNYKPADLGAIDSDFTANNSKRYSLRAEAAIQFADMARHFRKENKWSKIRINSAYRSSDFQESLLKRWCNPARCAKVGSSEHQLGLAIDIGVLSNGKSISLAKTTKAYQWFANNAHKFGFQNTYQKGIEVDGQMEEGRHRRYVGTGLATTLKDQNITLAEYYRLQSSF